MKPSSDLGLRIEFYRKRRGVRQYELEKAIGRSCQTFEHHRDNETMTVKELKQIAKVLKIKPADLLKEVTI